MEKEIRDMTETRTAHYLKYFCEHEKYKYQCRECKGSPRYALITSGNLNAKSAEGPKSAFITGKRKPAESAEDPKSALMTG